MARLKFFVFAVIAVAVAAFAVSAVSSSVAGAAQASAGDAARQAALAAAGEVAAQQQVLTQAALTARTSPEVAAVVESPAFARSGLTQVERLERLRVPVFASLPEDLRASARVWLVGEDGTARATLDAVAVAVGEAPAAPAPAPEEEGEEGAAAETAPAPEADEAVPEAAGLFRLGEVPYVVSAFELTPARGRLLIGAPLRLQPLDALVEGSPSLSVALVADGQALVSAGGIGAEQLVSQAAMAPVGGSAPVLRGASGALGPLPLPLFAGPADQTVQRVGSRHALTEGLEVGAIVDLSKVQARLVEGQKMGLYGVGGLAILGLFWTLIMGGSRKQKDPEDAEASSDDGSLRASLSVLPLDGGAASKPAASSTPAPPQPMDSPTPGPDDFQFPSEQPAPPAEAEEDDAAQALAAGGGGRSPVPPSYQTLPPTPVPAATSAVPPPAPVFSAPPVAAPPKPLDPFGMVSQGSPADSYYGDDNPDATRVAAVPQELLQASASSMPANAGASAVARPLGGVPSVAAPAVDPEEQHFHDVFQEFVATRARCGEPSEGVTYDKFVAKLRKNRDQLVQKYACRTVRFQVYVKEGKAALKATPVKD
ncbi:MAG TPA: MXAN_5187 family protein [Myxococcaceae bacterium]|nr:MXAN_5187 family protein [Myxococcaceae bacterium]